MTLDGEGSDSRLFAMQTANNAEKVSISPLRHD